MQCNLHREARRGGFSLIELLVVTAVVGVLLALLLPAVQQSREAARRTQCQSQMRQIGMALVHREEQHRRFPALGYYSSSGPEIFHSWVVEILPFLDQVALHEQWDFNQPNDDVTYSQNGKLAQTPLSLLVCPSDTTAVDGKSNQTYVVNAGVGWTKPADCPFSVDSTGTGLLRVHFDLSGDGSACPSTIGQADDQKLLHSMGLFFAENWPVGTGTVRHHTFKSITDGTTTTLMLSENVRAGFDPTFNSSWASPDVERQSFIVSPYFCDSFSCAPGSVNYSRANDRSALPYSKQAINSGLKQPEGEAPWPSSFHQAGVNFVFCDGHVSFVSENISGAVYAALASPQGDALTDALKQQPVSENDY